MAEPIRIPIELDTTKVEQQLAEFDARQAATMTTFPVDAINTLLSMIRKVTPFDLVAAIKAALEIATYLTTVFGTKSLALPITQTPEFGLEAALAQVLQQHKDGLAYARKHKLALHDQASGISVSLLNYILQEALKWIADKVSA